MRIAKVDSIEHRSLASSMGVSAYPTLKLVRADGAVVDFGGGRTAEYVLGGQQDSGVTLSSHRGLLLGLYKQGNQDVGGSQRTQQVRDVHAEDQGRGMCLPLRFADRNITVCSL